MTEKQFEKELLKLIKKYEEQSVSIEVFVEEARKLADKVEHKQIADIEDEELGWAMYWIEEIDYYGLEDVMQNRFNFFDFLHSRQS